ncbi:MAG: DNA polymerase III subunit gamma/tau [Pseudomonadota bacterium]|nr:DNA polymerase III subunit gamma/tau [Pseudomonadota bacterium]MEC8070998.1 DNA polymerase III subunit gamma/tau [Pseudomonadota bacterium]
MSYEVLARKLRPSDFSALVGQEHVVKALSHALDSGRLHHAYLFTGTRGVGKTTIARILAKSLNCEQGVSSTPCEQCSICLEVKENRFIDLIEVDAASRTGVDDTRDLLENAQYMPTRGRYKVYLIDEVHMLSMASFNALLKTLEEPPEHVKFLLATTDPKKVPVTVLSRCLQFQLKNLSAQMIADYLSTVLATEQIEFEHAGLEIIAKNAQGSMRDALSLTDQTIAFGQGKLTHNDVVTMLGVVGRDEVTALLEAIAEGSAEKLMDISGQLAERNSDFADVLRSMLEALHSMAVTEALGAPDSVFAADELQLYYQIALVGLRDLDIAPDPRNGFEMTLLRMLAFAPKPDSNVPPRISADDESKASIQTPDASAAESTADSAAADTEGETMVKQTPVDSVQPEPAPSMPPESVEGFVADEQLLARWYDIVEQLSVTGVAKMIAEHSVLRAMQLPAMELVLSDNHDTLLTDAQRQGLGRALQDQLGQEIELTVTIAAVSSETPSQRKDRLTQERQADAEATLERDTTVQSLLSEFGGKIESVRPL